MMPSYMDQHRQEILNLYKQGATVVDVARQLVARNVVTPTERDGRKHYSDASRLASITAAVRLVLFKEGIEIVVGRGRPDNASRDNTILVMRANGSTLRQIGEHFGLNPEVVRQIIIRRSRERQRQQK